MNYYMLIVSISLITNFYITAQENNSFIIDTSKIQNVPSIFDHFEKNIVDLSSQDKELFKDVLSYNIACHAYGSSHEYLLSPFKEKCSCVYEKINETKRSFFRNITSHWSPDQTKIAWVEMGKDRLVIWDRNSKQITDTIPLYVNCMATTVAWRNDSKAIAVNDWYRTLVRIFSLTDKKEECELKINAKVEDICWSYDEKYIGVCGQKCLRIYDLSKVVTLLTITNVASPIVNNVAPFAWSHSNKRVAVLLNNNIIELWNIHENKKTASIALNIYDIDRLIWNHDDSAVYVVGTDDDNNFQYIKWNIQEK